MPLRVYRKRYTKVGSYIIYFNKIIYDSRCPQDAMCVWAGEYKVQLFVYKIDTKQNNRLVFQRQMELGSGNANKCMYFEKDNFLIKLWDLKPHPTIYEKNDNQYLEFKVIVTNKKIHVDYSVDKQNYSSYLLDVGLPSLDDRVVSPYMIEGINKDYCTRI